MAAAADKDVVPDVAAAEVSLPAEANPAAPAGPSAAALAALNADLAAPTADAAAQPAAMAAHAAAAPSADEPAVAASGADEDEKPQMSRNQMKKMAKLERRREHKVARKAQEKERRVKEQEARKAEKRAAFGAMSPEEQEAHRTAVKARMTERRQENADRKARKQKAQQEGQRVVIDLDFDEQMTQSEVHSICHQLQFSYAVNSRAEQPCHLYFTSLKGRIGETARRQLAGIENWPDDVATVFVLSGSYNLVDRSEQSYLEVFAGEKERLVYLTADSEEELTDLDLNDVYIIGGLVDRNRHKNICFKRAEEQGIRTARLPISGLVQLTSSSVLTVNQVVEILLAYLAKPDWATALDKVIPQRKRAAGSAALVASVVDSKRLKSTHDVYE